jgi:hypothetical protein
VKSLHIATCCGLCDWPSLGGSRAHIKAKITTVKRLLLINSGVILRQLTVDTGWVQNTALVPPHRDVTWLMTVERGANGPWVLGCLYPASGKTQVFQLFLSLHHTNNRLENISVFLCPSTQLPQKKNILTQKKVFLGGWGHLPPPQFTFMPCHIYCEQL